MGRRSRRLSPGTAPGRSCAVATVAFMSLIPLTDGRSVHVIRSSESGPNISFPAEPAAFGLGFGSGGMAHRAFLQLVPDGLDPKMCPPGSETYGGRHGISPLVYLAENVVPEALSLGRALFPTESRVEVEDATEVIEAINTDNALFPPASPDAPASSIVPLTLLVKRGRCTFEAKARYVAQLLPSIRYVLIYDDPPRHSGNPESSSLHFLITMGATDRRNIPLSLMFISSHAGSELIRLLQNTAPGLLEIALVPHGRRTARPAIDMVLDVNRHFLVLLGCMSIVLAGIAGTLEIARHARRFRRYTAGIMEYIVLRQTDIWNF